MKLPPNLSRHRRSTGWLLIECLVYIVVFAILLGMGTAAFYFCWDHTKSLIYATDDIGSAMRAGERWRAEVRTATGKITVELSPAGEVVRIPGRGKEFIYRYAAGELRREVSPLKNPQVLFSNVKSFRMESAMRGGVLAWRWELELTERRQENHLPLLFTFEAAQTKP